MKPNNKKENLIGETRPFGLSIDDMKGFIDLCEKTINFQQDNPFSHGKPPCSTVIYCSDIKEKNDHSKYIQSPKFTDYNWMLSDYAYMCVIGNIKLTLEGLKKTYNDMMSKVADATNEQAQNMFKPTHISDYPFDIKIIDNTVNKNEINIIKDHAVYQAFKNNIDFNSAVDKYINIFEKADSKSQGIYKIYFYILMANHFIKYLTLINSADFYKLVPSITKEDKTKAAKLSEKLMLIIESGLTKRGGSSNEILLKLLKEYGSECNSNEHHWHQYKYNSKDNTQLPVLLMTMDILKGFFMWHLEFYPSLVVELIRPISPKITLQTVQDHLSKLRKHLEHEAISPTWTHENIIFQPEVFEKLLPEMGKELREINRYFKGDE